MEKITVANLDIEVVRKDIKNMHLAVYPPDGRIRLAAPNQTDPEVVRMFAISKLGWLKKHIKNLKAQEREAPRDYVSGESNYFQGKRFLLKVKEAKGNNKVSLSGFKHLEMHVKPGTNIEDKAKLIKEWYRHQLKTLVPLLLDKWQPIMQVECKSWGIKQMQTKWGSCNPEAGRIWLNLELAKKPIPCLEYIIVHELTHLLERHHNDRFVKYMDQFMPKWRQHRDLLNSLPVVHRDWGY